jgi:hypothetical protein
MALVRRQVNLLQCSPGTCHAFVRRVHTKWYDDGGGVGVSPLAVDLQKSEAEGGHFVPIGSNGFYPMNGKRARFDQQPVEAQGMVSACLEAHPHHRKKSWHREARRAFEWFLGRNDLHLPVYDPTTGGCRDGLHPDRPNENQGAESTLAFLQSLLELRLAKNIMITDEDRHIDHSTLAVVSTPQTQPHPDRRELAVSGQ